MANKYNIEFNSVRSSFYDGVLKNLNSASTEFYQFKSVFDGADYLILESIIDGNDVKGFDIYPSADFSHVYVSVLLVNSGVALVYLELGEEQKHGNGNWYKFEGVNATDLSNEVVYFLQGFCTQYKTSRRSVEAYRGYGSRYLTYI